MNDRPAPPENVQQTASIGNIQSGGNTTIGDINKTVNQYLQQKAEFVERTKLEDFKSPKFPSPLGVDERIEALYKSRLLLLGGIHEDKSDLVLHLAIKLREKVQSDLPVFEWIHSSDPQSIVVEIRGERTKEGEKPKESIIFYWQIFNLNTLTII